MASVPVTFLSIFGLPQMTKGGLKKAVLDKTTKLSGALADRIWCDSHSMLEFLVSHRLCRPRKAMVIANGSVNGVDAEEAFRPEKYPPDIRELNRAKYGIPSQATVLGFVGRISKDKGIDDLLDAWRILQVKPFDLRLLLIGPREEDDPLRPDNAELLCSDENIHLLGPLSDVAAHLALIDIYVMPSHREGFGITNIEASAMELPVISTAIPGCVDSVKDGETGVLVPPRSPEALAEAIERYLSAPELAKRHGKRGRARVLSDFRPDMIWQGLLESYSELLKAKRR